MAEVPTTAGETKSQFSPDYNDSSEFETREDGERLPSRSMRLVESARLGLSVLTLLMGISILSTSADAIAVFNKTHVSEDFLLPLWPFNFNLGPSIAIVTGGAVIVVSSAIAILAGRIPVIRSKALIHSILSLVAPTAGLIAAIVATSFFYAVNSSDTVDSLQSWSCRWAGVQMDSEPHFGKLCDESQASLYMTIVMIPLEVMILGLGAMTIFAERKAAAMHHGKNSPAMS